MRSRAYDPFKASASVNTDGRRVGVYEILIDGGRWEDLVRDFQLNGFSEIPEGIAVIDKRTGMIRLRLAFVIEEE